MPESYDAELAEERDKSRYQDKGQRATTAKTAYGKDSDKNCPKGGVDC